MIWLSFNARYFKMEHWLWLNTWHSNHLAFQFNSNHRLCCFNIFNVFSINGPRCGFFVVEAVAEWNPPPPGLEPSFEVVFRMADGIWRRSASFPVKSVELKYQINTWTLTNQSRRFASSLWSAASRWGPDRRKWSFHSGFAASAHSWAQSGQSPEHGFRKFSLLCFIGSNHGLALWLDYLVGLRLDFVAQLPQSAFPLTSEFLTINTGMCNGAIKTSLTWYLCRQLSPSIW